MVVVVGVANVRTCSRPPAVGKVEEMANSNLE